jgi:cellulose synthase/poly-beta-1,6-N-acetylglucosamine synthase-like glycosyltransferase
MATETHDWDPPTGLAASTTSVDAQSRPASRRRVDLSIVVPAYNELQRLPRSLERIVGYLEEQGRDFEIVVVDDGSTDGTAEAAAIELAGLGTGSSPAQPCQRRQRGQRAARHARGAGRPGPLH